MVKIVWTTRSIKDIEQIADYISKDSVKYAMNVVSRILDAENIILFNVRAGRVVPEFKNNTIREVFVGYYRIVYRIKSEKEIQILTVYHMARKLTVKRILE